jgi:hypothetical protein
MSLSPAICKSFNHCFWLGSVCIVDVLCDFVRQPFILLDLVQFCLASVWIFFASQEVGGTWKHAEHGRVVH